jgi:predicted dehydrogenase
VVRVAVVGLGKMGLSHLALLNAHPDADVVAVCDSSGYLLGVLGKYTGIQTYADINKMLAAEDLDAVVIATPSSLHAPMVRTVIAQGVHVFCEKPFCLDDSDGLELALAAERAGLVTQIGYHNRFVGAFREVKRLLDAQAIGRVTHVLAEAYGPVVLRQQGSTWRSKKTEGGGCLYDYAAHPINLVNWFLGEPTGVGGTRLNKVFSRETDDEVLSTLYFENDVSSQVSVSWSDESVRKMTTKITVWGTGGRIYADRQECQAFIRSDQPLDGYRKGWNVRYTTELSDPVYFYLRGEEYSAQLDHFICRVSSVTVDGENTFASAVQTDRTLSMMIEDAVKGASTTATTAMRGVTTREVSTPDRSEDQSRPRATVRLQRQARLLADKVLATIDRWRDRK